MKVEFYLSIGIGGDITEIVELPDELSEEEVESEFQEWRNGYLDASWRVVVPKNTLSQEQL